VEVVEVLPVLPRTSKGKWKSYVAVVSGVIRSLPHFHLAVELVRVLRDQPRFDDCFREAVHGAVADPKYQSAYLPRVAVRQPF